MRARRNMKRDSGEILHQDGKPKQTLAAVFHFALRGLSYITILFVGIKYAAQLAFPV